MDVKFQYKTLVESLRLLATSYNDQISFLPEFVELPYEVTSIFENSFLVIPQIIESNLLSIKAIASIIRCYNWINFAIRNKETSSHEAFKNHETWNKIRKFAQMSLIEMNEEVINPNLDYINFIE